MKKVFFILLAVVFAAGTINAKKPKPNTIAVWDGKQVVYNQPLADMDSITFTTSSNLLTKAAICKTWTGIPITCSSCRYKLTLNSDNTFSYSEDGDNCSGRYYLQGKLIILCINVDENVSRKISLPTCLAYDNNVLYGNFLSGIGPMMLH